MLVDPKVKLLSPPLFSGDPGPPTVYVMVPPVAFTNPVYTLPLPPPPPPPAGSSTSPKMGVPPQPPPPTIKYCTDRAPVGTSTVPLPTG